MNRFAALCLCLAAVLPAAAQVSWNAALRQPAGWYGSDEARALAATLVQYQDETGGWPKNTDFNRPPSPAYLASSESARAPTIDNGGTTTPLQFLARVITARPDAELQERFARGLDYLFAAQYENGGWPQFYPLRRGYYSHITFNDNAGVNVLLLLRAVGEGRPPFAFVDDARRARARAAVERGIGCLLRTQVREPDGRLTGWCAQHDEKTLAPAWARAFEPPSLSGMETVGIVRFLMGIESPPDEVRAAIDGAVGWLQSVPVRGLKLVTTTAPDGTRDRRAVPDPDAPPLWARFYELGTHRPIFLGRDRTVRYDFNEIEPERRLGYAYLGSWPADLLAKEYPRWRQKVAAP